MIRLLFSLLIFLPALVQWPASVAAKPRPMRFEHITLEDGLSQSTVMDILQDSQGFMWFGTENGLNRYDGYSIRHYSRDRRDPSSFSSDFIWEIAEDQSGDLWLATEGGGVVRWSRNTDSFKSYMHDEQNQNSIASNLIRALMIDDGGQVWIGTRESGLDHLDPLTGKVKHYRHDPTDNRSLSSNAVYEVFIDRSGQLWVGTDNGLNRFDPSTGSFHRYVHNPADPRSLSDNHVVSLFEDQQGALWIGTFGGGLNRLDRMSGLFTRFNHLPDDSRSISHPHVRAIFEDDKNRLWIGTADGLNLLDRETGEFTRYRQDRSDPDSLGDSYIMSVYQDRSGLLWVGTRSGGVSKWNPGSWALGFFAGDWLDGVSITSFADTGAGDVWVGTLGDGLARLNLDSREVEHYRHDPNQPQGTLSDDWVMSLLLDREDVLWIGTMSGGLNRMNPITGEITAFRHNAGDTSSLSADGVMSLFEDRSGNIWIGTFGGGVSLFDRDTQTFEQFVHDPAKPGSLSSPRATAIIEDANGAIWVATDGGGLNMLDRTSRTFLHFRHDPKDPTSLSSDSIYSLHVDGQSRLWVGTAGDGLGQLVGSSERPEDISFQEIPQIRHEVGESIYGIKSDYDGGIWLSTNNGLARFDPLTDKLKTLHRSHGLQGDEFNFGAHHQGQDGMLFFGGTQGFNAFYPYELEDSRVAPPVVLTSVEIMNQPAKTTIPHNLLRDIEIGYADDVVTFEFAALDFSDPEQNRYAYQLAGFDDHWIDVGNRHRVSYTNLDAADYVFRVKAANSNGVWNTDGISLELHVQAAPWETWWANTGYVLLVLLVFVSVWRVQLRKFRQKEKYSQRLEIEVRDRTHRLEEQNEELQKLSAAKMEFLARMSHEIRTPMNGVLGMMELLLGTSLSDQQKRFANTVHNSAESLLEIINDILDFSKIEAGKVQLESVEFDLNELVEETIGLLAGSAYEKSLELHCATPIQNHTLLRGDPHRLRQVLVNLIGNAVKFTSEGEIVVRCSISDEQDDTLELFFEVSDTGVGISEEAQEKIFESFSQEDGSTTRRFGGTGLGLAISKQLVELMGGELGVESRLDEGSTFSFTVRLKKVDVTHQNVRIPGNRKQLRVLVVDGNSTSREILEKQLHAWQMRPACFENTGQALTGLAVARSEGDLFDLAILDTSTESSSVEHLIGLLCEDQSFAAIKLLLINGIDVVMDINRQRRLGVQGSLTKPVRQSDLLNALMSLTENKPLLTQSTVADQLQSDDTGALNGRVLLVEDNQVNQAVAMGMLEQFGCDVVLANHGREALALTATEQFDVVLMDCQMPVMDGFQATAAIRTREGSGHRTPIIALTANALEGDRGYCLAAGMDDYLSKPFTLRTLHRVITRWLEPRSYIRAVDSAEADNDKPDTLLDPAALHNIRSIRGPDGNDMLEQVIELYLSTAGELMDQLKQGLDDGDAPSVYRAAHDLKSSSANLGAKKFSAACQQMENLARQNKLGDVGTLYQRLNNLHLSVFAALQLEIGRESA